MRPRALLLAGLVAALFATGLAADEKQAFHVVGYLPEYRLSAFDAEQARHVTDLVYFSVEPTAEGDFKRNLVREGALAKLHAIKAKHPLTLLLSVGGWGRSAGFAPVTASDKTRQALVANLARFCRENQFDGIDLDWEHPADDA